MSDETYVDPNSGAAPQPGGWAGPEGMENGHAVSADVQVAAQAELAQEQLDNAPDTEPFDPEQAARDLAAAEAEQAERDAEAAEEDAEEDDENGEDGASENEEDGAPVDATEEEASDAMALETQGVNLAETKEEGYDPSSGSVEDVLAYVKANPDQKDQVLEAEKAGKNRSGVVNALG